MIPDGQAALFDVPEEDMIPRALTIRQPWASLITAGIKDVENRTWHTAYRGILIIHAGRPDPQPMSEHAHLLEGDVPAGAIIGTVRVAGCIRDSDSQWAIPGQWHWILTDPRPCRPLPARGQLSLWTPTGTQWSWVRRTRTPRPA